MFKRGLRLFAAGALGLFGIALLHVLGHFSSPPEDAARTAVLQAMRA